MTVSKKNKNFPIGKLIIIIMLLSFLATTFLPIFAFNLFGNKLSFSDKEELLDDLSKKKKDIAQKLKEAREKEAVANSKLREIQRRLNQAKNRLEANKKYLETNQDAWLKTKQRLDEIKIQRQSLEEDARQRVVSIYKQQRLKLIDGLMNSPSITDFLDHIYYQKRVINYDKEVLSALVDQSETIKHYNEILSKEAAKIAQINKKLADTENEIATERNNQKQIVSKLQKETSSYEESERQLEKESVALIYKITELSGSKQDNPNATGSFKYPVKARITSPFGPRRHPIFGVRSMHSGIDLAAPNSTPIQASEGGLVIYSGWYGGYGRVVIVDHSKGYTSLYAHMQRTAVKVGDRVKQGDTLGYEGSTGYATGPHLHFEIRVKGKPQNPVNYLG